MSITIASADAQGNPLGGENGTFSPDGTQIIFDSDAFYFGYQDPNDNEVYEKSLFTGAVTRVTSSRYGGPADGRSTGGVFSPDGTKIAFTSSSTTIAGSGQHTYNDFGDLFVLANGTSTRISNSYDGSPVNGSSGGAAFSPDGTQVAYISSATNLVPNDTNNIPDIFVTNLATHATTRISTDSSGAQATGSSAVGTPVWTPDGQSVIFSDAASNLVANDTNGDPDIFEKNLGTGATTRLSVAADGSEADGQSLDPAVSADGTRVAFDSSATNLVANDTNGTTDIFVKTLATGAITRVSVAADGTQANGASSTPVFSPDGTKIAFVSEATNLTSLHVANAHANIFLKNLVTGAVTQVSVSYDGSEIDGDSSAPHFSPDGTKIVFTSTATNIVPNDTDEQNDVFVATVPVCFAAGTQIRRTRAGDARDIAVEDLAVGDLAVTASGAHRPIRWLGHRTVDCARHPQPRSVWPVRIAAHAFGKGRPVRDLLVSPGHAICVDLHGDGVEVLIPAGSLINGATVTQDEVDTVTYWHVELDSHDILLAEGLPAESYLECGNRAWFAGGAVRVDADQAASTPDLFCRPFVASGEVVAACRARLAVQAEALGWTTTGDMDLHGMVGDQRIEPVVEGDLACLVIPAGATSVDVTSATFAPAWWSGSDDRRLGLHLHGLRVSDGFGRVVEIALDDPALAPGLHAEEHAERTTARWTTGRLTLPAHLWARCAGSMFLQVRVSPDAGQRWIAPAGADRIDDKMVPRAA